LASAEPVAAQEPPAGCTYTEVTLESQKSGSRGFGYVEANLDVEPVRVLVCATGDGRSIAAFGGGSGGVSRCTPTPVGDLAEVRAVYEAVNAEQTPNPVNTAYVEDELQPGQVP
jgi:hypothetical protein